MKNLIVKNILTSALLSLLISCNVNAGFWNRETLGSEASPGWVAPAVKGGASVAALLFVFGGGYWKAHYNSQAEIESLRLQLQNARGEDAEATVLKVVHDSALVELATRSGGEKNSALAALRSELGGEKNSALAALRGELGGEKDSALAELRSELGGEKDSALAALRSELGGEKDSALADLRSELGRDKDLALADLRSELGRDKDLALAEESSEEEGSQDSRDPHQYSLW